MKTIKLAFALIIATLAMTACVEDKVYEGPSTIEAVSINPEAPTSFDDVEVTAKVSGLLKVTKAVLRFSVDDDQAEDIEMTGDGSIYTAIIPAMEDDTNVKYAVIITNEAGYTSIVEKDYTVGDKPSDYTQLVINELYGAGADNEKYIELYNKGKDPIKLAGVVIKKDEGEAWVGAPGEIIMGESYFKIVGAKNTVGEGSDSSRGLSSGLSSKKSVLIEIYNPNNTLIDKFQRGEKGEEWGKQSLTDNKRTWSRCPNGTGKFMIADKTLGAKNPDTGEEDPTVVQ